MYFNNAEWLLSRLYPSLVWSKNRSEKKIYLTFDDGPVPEITDYVLDELKKHQIKATFFCVGDNIFKYPEIYKKIVQQGHVTGNHTFNHLKGWKTENQLYLENIKKCEDLIQQASRDSGKKIFRPPYGKITKSQIKNLNPDYEIIMWDVLTGDFNKDLSEEKCLHKSIKYTREGSIVIFHDSYKAEKNLKYVLPKFIKHFLDKGFTFETL